MPSRSRAPTRCAARNLGPPPSRLAVIHIRVQTLDDKVDRSAEWHPTLAGNEIAAKELYPTLRRTQDEVGLASGAVDQKIVGFWKRRSPVDLDLRPSISSRNG
jgi:hypothetical protein